MWPDRCAVTGLYSDMALMSLPTSVCECDSCQRWAFGTLRQMHVRVIGPLLAGEEQQALAVLKEIARELPLPPRPAPPVPQPML